MDDDRCAKVAKTEKPNIRPSKLLLLLRNYGHRHQNENTLDKI